MGNIKPAYTTRPIPDTKEFVETRYNLVQEYLKDDEGEFERDENGKKIKKGPITMVKEDVKTYGGTMVTMPRGHSVRLTSLDQALALHLIPQELFDALGGSKGDVTKLRAKLVDLDSGEEVNEQGVPVSLAQYVNGGGEEAAAAME